jgi:hypothetical protein
MDTKVKLSNDKAITEMNFPYENIFNVYGKLSPEELSVEIKRRQIKINEIADKYNSMSAKEQKENENMYNKYRILVRINCYIYMLYVSKIVKKEEDRREEIETRFAELMGCYLDTIIYEDEREIPRWERRAKDDLGVVLPSNRIVSNNVSFRGAKARRKEGKTKSN